MNSTLALHGGTPVRTQPFGATHDFGEDDIERVEDDFGR